MVLKKLHELTMPFILRRTKENVLKELPPKIVQDYYCSLTAIQQQIYSEFEESLDSSSQNDLNDKLADNSYINNSKKNGSLNQFHILRKVCIHPKLAVEVCSDKLKSVFQNHLLVNNIDSQSIELSGKFTSLVDLLKTFNLYPETSGSLDEIEPVDDALPGKIVDESRFLLFYQLKPTKLLIESMMQKLYPSHKYLKIDSEIPPDERVGLCKKYLIFL